MGQTKSSPLSQRAHILFHMRHTRPRHLVGSDDVDFSQLHEIVLLESVQVVMIRKNRSSAIVHLGTE